jgi:ABC-type transport system involved in multi-copper enzyme maturation permease subunit
VTFAAAAAAQTGAELRQRLRSPATLVALAAILAGTLIWIPTGRGRAVSISWQTAAGALQAPLFTSRSVAVSATFFGAIFLMLAGFYLVAGSVRRDRERGVGAILAASPLSNEAYLFGKFTAHLAYLAVLALVILVVAVLRFAIEGVGPFEPLAFLVPITLFALPSLAFTAAMAVAFDVIPGLRSRAGWIIWFFTFGFVVSLTAIPARTGKPGGRGLPLFDPAGAGTLEQLVVASLPDARPGSIATGHIIRDHAPERVAWNGIVITPSVVWARLAALLWTIPPLLAALLAFDRFDPACKPRTGRLFRRRMARDGLTEGADRIPSAPLALSALPSPPHPSLLRSVAAESLLLWQTASLARWLLLAGSVTAVFVPKSAISGVLAAWLILLIPMISEAAAREDIAGTQALVFSQPGIPLRSAPWKALSIALFVGVAALPILARLAATSPERAAGFALGLVFVSGFAAGAGAISRGGKLFAAVYLCLWYAAASGLADADFAGAFTMHPDLRVCALFALAGIGWVAVAAAVEKLRRG